MALQFMDKRLIGAYIVDAWQNHFNTEQDPADGQWFTNGPGNNGGLYGQLTDTLASELVFLQDQSVFTPHKVAAFTSIADNRNGLLKPGSTVTLTHAYQNQSSVTHSTTSALKLAYGVDFKAKAEFLGTGGETTVKFSSEYSFSWTDATTVTKSETLTFNQSVPVPDVPQGKAYQLTLTCDKDDLKVPYFANIYLSGQSTANFGSPVSGQKVWSVDAGTLCEWINQFGSAGDESYKYGRNPDNPKQGFIQLRGTLTATQTENFNLVVIDVTDTYNPAKPTAVTWGIGTGDQAAVGGKVISTQALGQGVGKA